MSAKTGSQVLYLLCVTQLIVSAWLKGRGIFEYVGMFMAVSALALILYLGVLNFSSKNTPGTPSWNLFIGHLLIWSCWTAFTVALPFILRAAPHLHAPVTESVLDSLFRPTFSFAPVMCMVSMHRHIKIVGRGGLFGRDR